jgi:hypothetical protein
VPIILLIVPMDPLTGLFAHATPTARTFVTGNLCQTAQFTDVGHLHLLRCDQEQRRDLILRSCPLGAG